jgi:hypothetical protein
MGKQLYLLIIFIVVFSLPTMSQKKHSDFLFEKYQEATIYFIGGSLSNEKVNYNVKDRELYYLDREDGSEKIVINTEKIRALKIDNRNFIMVKRRLQEVLPTTPPIYVEYLAKVKPEALNAGYGTTSETASISPYSLNNSGELSQDGRKMETIGLNNEYWIEKNGKKEKFTSFKQLLKIYSKHKKVLDDHIKTNKINFNDIEGIVNLCLYAESLN